MEVWGAEAEQLVAGAEPVVACLLLQWRGAASIVRAPERADRLYALASEAAEQSGSALAKGDVAAWQLHTRLCQPEGGSSRVHWSLSDFGGRDSMGWSSAGTTGLLHEARLGHLAEAEALLAAVTRIDSLQPSNIWGDHTLVLALAGDQTDTLADARTVLDDADVAVTCPGAPNWCSPSPSPPSGLAIQCPRSPTSRRFGSGPHR